MRHITLVADWMDPDLKDKIDQKAGELGFETVWFSSDAEAVRDAGRAEILFGMAPEALKAGGGIRWLCLPFAGIDRFTAPGVVPEGVAVTNSAGAYGTAISEHVIMVILMLLRREHLTFGKMAAGEWHREEKLESLWGKRVCVCGTGDLGRNCAVRIRAFSPASLVGVSRSGRPLPGFFDAVFPSSQADRALRDADVVILALPGTDDTEDFLSRERMALLPGGAYIVNVGRGRCLDEEALIEGLRSGRVAGAALDVMRHEPPAADDPLWHAPNLILTPHCAGNMTVRATRENCAAMFLEDLENYASGRELKHRVSLRDGY